MKSKLSYSDNIQLLSEQNIKKFILPQYNLKNANIKQIKFKNTEKQRAVYKVSLFDNNYCLKKVYFQANDLLFIYSAVEWLYRYGINVPRILPTKDKNRYVNYKNMLFILTPWINGIKCDYNNENHVLDAIYNLAKIHISTENFVSIIGSRIRNNYNHIYKSFCKHYDQILINSNTAFKIQDEFSQLYLEHFETNEKLSKLAMECSCNINIDNLQKSLCHLDYVNKNLIFDYDNNIWVIDFDKCAKDYNVHDISYFLRRYLKREKTKWDFDITIKCLNEYEKLHNLNIDEYKYILSYLVFPQKYWKISRDYYNNISNCNKKAFVAILCKAVALENQHLEFANRFLNYINTKFNTLL